MTSNAAEHYENHLAAVYVWMSGGVDAALQAGGAEIDALQLPIQPGDVVIDLGAGFGMHALALARKGARVTAIDSSARLLQTLSELASGLPVRAVHDDLLAFHQYIDQAPSAIVCMGDTITHLPTVGDVQQLMEQACRALRVGGTFVITLRDYSEPLVGAQRFIPVRSDDTRILTCFLEYEEEGVLVHDILHERTADGWRTRVSQYRKLRLAPDHLITCLQSHGCQVLREAGVRGMVRLIATRV